ncbi:hypothetical protein FNV43_RR07622 [Rhamnella rubrinervis]|uniref:Terpene synthase metal-binding domain-containing protein n=1 Tax=Rhamnella rubrinervis TaxID=2594499 RepID=A0A8K0HFA8_9ROSA|nr:hypothetical protein FNV43_RR07622 [Rhamnella rubrinervis]
MLARLNVENVRFIWLCRGPISDTTSETLGSRKRFIWEDCSLPYDSDVRMMVAKSAIVITVADDFFDIEGSLSDLQTLTHAIQRWDDKGLSAPAKTIFHALDNIVQNMANKYLRQQGSDIRNELRDLWYETFESWMTEAKWSRSESLPSIDEYLKVGMTSIATHTIVLPASCFLNSSLRPSNLRPSHYHETTKLLMIISRLLNDIIQSYQKDEDEGKLNSILLHMENNKDLDIGESIAYVRGIVEKKKEELVEHVLMDYSFASDDHHLQKLCTHLHLSCLKVFNMFFNSSNKYDTNTEMLDDIIKAIYSPLQLQSSNSNLTPPLSLPLESKSMKLLQSLKPNLEP